ncbi:GNAT family N-acetyltransferase [Streptomyces sp. YU58]|uniref:GNAT family N-acetyltransferase n=1 Tax=Streptomyces sp. SX92 TaxID=3158972 RepID=UPI0027B8A8B4|nr:GNAT family N-acetyltransferase [Streptomyces coralus]WLW54231.1 GNAT family N-acetyltransferase [Streptomyces coralus]
MRPDSWHRTEDLDRFLARAGGFLRSRPALHTVPLTVTEGLRTGGARTYGDDPPVFGTLERDGAVRAAYFRTPPHLLYVTGLTPEEADSLAAHLSVLDGTLPGVNADRETAASFATAWRTRTGGTATLRQRQRLYRLGTSTPPEPLPPGRARVAGERDRALLVRWHTEFAEAIGGRALRDSGDWADARISYGGVTLWEAPDGTPVSMAGVTPTVAGQARVAPVYTPSHLRGRGYAGAVTAEVGRAVRDAGAQEVLLFTDLANPTSNGLYQRIGYRPVADFAVYAFQDTRSPRDPQGPQDPQGQSSS